MLALTPTPFERGLRSTQEFITKPDPTRPKRCYLSEEERLRRRRMVLEARDRFGTFRRVAQLMELSETTVTRWGKGRSLVGNKYVPTLEKILEDA